MPPSPAPRPAFLEAFPSDDALAAASEAFVRGDYLDARRRAKALRDADGASAEVKRAAGELLLRTTPDPLAGILLGVAFALLVALTVYWLGHDGPKPH